MSETVAETCPHCLAVDRLSPEERDFLLAVKRAGGLRVTRKHLPLADRAEDKRRQKLRKLGLVRFMGGWSLTEDGRIALLVMERQS